jgi:hypothetical protein
MIFFNSFIGGEWVVLGFLISGGREGFIFLPKWVSLIL